MAMGPEGKVKAKLAKGLKEMGAYYFFPATGGYGRNGVADVVGCYKGQFFSVECKAGNNPPTALQLRELSRVNKANGFAAVCNEDNVSHVLALISMLGGLEGENYG